MAEPLIRGDSMAEKPYRRVMEATALLLFTLQAIRVLFSMLFARVYDAVFDGEGLVALLVAAVLTLLALLAPLFLPRHVRHPRRWMAGGALACALARLLLQPAVPALGLYAAIAVLGAANFYLAGLLRWRARRLPPALGLAALLDQFLRALGYTYDPSLWLWWLPIQVLLSGGVIWLALWRPPRGQEDHGYGHEPGPERAGFGAGLALGVALFLLASLLALPNAAARWTGGSYPILVALLLALTALPLWPSLQRWVEEALAPNLVAKIIMVLLALAGLALAYQARGPLSLIALAEAAAAFWLLLPLSLRAGSHHARWGLALGMLAFLLLAVSHAFSFTYAYTLAFFKGAGLPTFLAAGVVALVPACWVRKGHPLTAPALAWPRWWPWAGAAILAGATVVSLPWLPRLAQDTPAVRLGTYNIHYGFDTHWHLSLEAQARTIAASGAQVVALQEVDTGRLTSFGVDNALWLSRRLGMRAIYLPTVEHTTGIALLSKLQVRESDGILLPSQGEPTGIVRATVQVGGQPLRAHGIWLGLSEDERLRQLTAGLEWIGPGRATLAGDMNATSDSPVYALMVAQGFIDPFTVHGFAPQPTDPAEEPTKRIDYVWLRGLRPTEARVLDSLASDHRMVVVEAR